MNWWFYAIILVGLIGFFSSMTVMVISEMSTANQCISQKGNWNGTQCSFQK